MKINIVDSVVIEEASVVCYIYTGRDGYIKSKPESHFGLLKVRNDFLKIAKTLQNQCEVTLAVLYRAEGQPSVLNAELLNSLCAGSTPTDPLVLQCYVPSKGNPTAFATFR